MEVLGVQQQVNYPVPDKKTGQDVYKRQDALKKKIESTTKTKIETAKVDADNAAEVAELIRAYKPDAVLNLSLIHI